MIRAVTAFAPIVTLTTDFGTREYYAGAVKGAILGVCPEARTVDITHEVDPHDILEAAFTLASAYSAFPPETIHLVVVDPGVGSERRGIVVASEKHFFVAPDNGVLSLIFQRERITRAVSIEAERYFRRPVAATFHGRDVFGPVAAHIACGVDLSSFGPEIADYLRLDLPSPVLRNELVEGVVLHIDKFGNLVTNISPEDVARLSGVTPFHPVFKIGGEYVERHVSFYAQGERERLFSLVGSSGYYEIAACRQPASRLLDARRGSAVEMKFRPD